MESVFKSIAVIFFTAMLSFELDAADVQFSWGRERVEALGLNRATLDAFSKTEDAAERKRIFSVHADQPALLFDPLTPAIAGRYEVKGNSLFFTPSFPFEPGVKYRAVIREAEAGSSKATAPIVSTHIIEKPALTANTVVANIYPSFNQLPENLLKFYIQFSAPMSGGNIYEHIDLLDERGDPVELPFLEIDEELWDPTMTRLTLFLDPGRIKRGVKPLEEIGASLRPGRSYTLRISESWKDARGVKLAKGFSKKFNVVEADRTTPDPARWKIIAPKSGGAAPLVIHFDEPLDHAIAIRTISILGHDGAPLSGSASLANDEREFRFAPGSPWKGGKHHVRLPSLIEDLAGNNIGEPFDVDLSEGERRRRENRWITLPFSVE